MDKKNQMVPILLLGAGAVLLYYVTKPKTVVPTAVGSQQLPVGAIGKVDIPGVGTVYAYSESQMQSLLIYAGLYNVLGKLPIFQTTQPT